MRALAVLLLGLTLWPNGAAAHMPLLRELSVAEGGARVVGRMPGFGFLVQQDGAAPRYLCDALVGVAPGELEVPWLSLPSGELLVGTQSGLRALSGAGCPGRAVGKGLPVGAVSALALDASGQVLTVIGGQPPTLHRSADGGTTFAPLSELPSSLSVSGLRVGPASDQLVALQVSATLSTLVSWSSDAGATWRSERYDGALTPLALLDDGALIARRTVAGQRGVQIVRVASPAAAAEAVLDLNYFGGFARDRVGDGLWVGDEGGGLYRSEGEGLNFVQMKTQRAPACLAQDEGALWACFAGLPEQAAVARFENERFVDAGSLADAVDMVRCDGVDVAQVCAAAWSEWQVDVLLAAGVVLDGVDAGSAQDVDAGRPAPVAEDAGVAPIDTTSGTPDAALLSDLRPASSAGCHVARPAAGGAHPIALLLSMLAPLFVLARTRRRDDLVCAAMEGKPTSSAQEDATLVACAQTGDPDAFMALFDRHAPVMLAVGRRILGDESQAEDLLQDVFLEAWRAVRSYDPQRATVRTWLLVRMRSRALDRLDRRALEARAQQLLARTPSTPGPTLETTLAVRQGINGLDAEVREALELTYYLGMTAPEVAACLGIPEGTVRSRLSRGSRALAQVIDEEEPDDEA